MKEKKNKKLIVFIIILFIFAGIFMLSRYYFTTGLVVKEYKIKDKKLPSNFHGMKIIHISDLYYGNTTFINDLNEIKKNVNIYKPDIIVFTGDLIGKDDNKGHVKKFLSELNASIEKIAIYGNNDYNYDYESIMLSGGFKVLKNDCQYIYKDDLTPINICGFESSIKGNENYAVLNNEEYKNYYNIVLNHEPDQISRLSEYKINLMLAGHSLNGQIKIPFVGGIIPKEDAKLYFDDYYKVNNTLLYISGGIGTSKYPYRFLNKPSINLYRFYSK